MLPNILIGTAVGLALVFLWRGYNRLVRSRNQVREAWSGIDVQLRRRTSLVPNLVETVRAYAHHERDTFERVIRARAALREASGAREAANANDALTFALARVFGVVESYPQLRASENFRTLQSDLGDIEEKIAYARRFYNRTVLDFNNRIDTFPSLLIARAFAFTPAEFFDAGEEGRRDVRVSFDSAVAAGGRPAAPPVA